MRRVSKKRAALLRIYAKYRRNFLAANPFCVFPNCFGIATEVHHSVGRRGADLLRVETWKAMCHDHHVFVTERPLVAKELGLSGSRTGRAS